MREATYKKLIRLGYDKEFLDQIKHFKRDKSKKYNIRVTNVESLNDRASDGEFICYASFNTIPELIEIVSNLEGMAYDDLSWSESEKNISASIIDDGMLEFYDELIIRDIIDEYKNNKGKYKQCKEPIILNKMIEDGLMGKAIIPYLNKQNIIVDIGNYSITTEYSCINRDDFKNLSRQIIVMVVRDSLDEIYNDKEERNIVDEYLYYFFYLCEHI